MKKERNRTYKRSRQRERVLELLQSTSSHPSADWIYQRLKQEMPDLSMATVYRNLHVLEEQGLVGKIGPGVGSQERFDGQTRPHYHFICESCGAFLDLELPIDEELNERAARATPFVVRRHRLEFYGLCDRCAGKPES